MPAKDFACICVRVFCTIYESGVFAQGVGGEKSMARKPVIEQIKMLCLSNKKEITEIKFCSTNFLKMIITRAIFAAFIWKCAAASAFCCFFFFVFFFCFFVLFFFVHQKNNFLVI